jgi:hypothetical protein
MNRPGIFYKAGEITGSGIMDHHGPTPHAIPLPDSLVFYLGNFAGGSFSVRWDGTRLLVEESVGGNFQGTSRVVIPGRKRWESFWNEIDQNGVWSWEENYASPHGCCGVTYWQLVIKAGRRSVSCSGEDRFPGGDSPAITPGFQALLTAIKALCRE